MSTPSWPSLYNPGIEIINIEHNSAVQPGGAYLNHPGDVFRFTLYWTLIFYCPVFVVCGAYAFWNLNFPPAPRPHNLWTGPESNCLREGGREHDDDLWLPDIDSSYPLSPLTRKPEPSQPQLPPPSAALPSTSASFPTPAPFQPTTSGAGPHSSSNWNEDEPTSSQPYSTKKPKYKYKERERQSRFTFALLVLLLFLCAGVAGALLSSAVVGFTAAAFFSSADYNMSTWIPFLLAVIAVLVGLLSLWPSIIDII